VYIHDKDSKANKIIQQLNSTQKLSVQEVNDGGYGKKNFVKAIKTLDCGIGASAA
jgi:hypothetical protein